MDYYTQFDILSVFYVDGRLATHHGAQNHTVNENFQICQLNDQNVDSSGVAWLFGQGVRNFFS